MAGAVFSFNIDLRANTAGMTRGFGKARQELGLFSGNVRSLTGGLASFGIAGATAGAAVVALTNVFSAGKRAAQAFIDTVVVGGIQSAASFEQQQISLETMLGSLKDANMLLGDLTTFASQTPFEFTELTEAAKSLTAFGVSQDEVIPTMRMLGDLASGLNIPFSEIAELYGKMRVQGRLFAEDINQLTGRGIPIISELAKQFGVPEAAIRKLVETGQVNFSHLERAFIDLTSEGGKFAGLMEKQSKSVLGLWSTLRDNLSLTLMEIGKDITEAFDIRGALSGVIELTGELKNAFQAGFGEVLHQVSGIGEALLGFEVSATDVAFAVGQAFVVVADALYEVRLGILGMKATFGGAQEALDLAFATKEGSPGSRIIKEFKRLREEAARAGSDVGQSLSRSIATAVSGNDIFGNILDFATGLGLNEVLRPKSMVEQPKFSDLSPAALAARTTEAFSAALKNTKTAQADPVVKGIRDLIKAQGEEVAATNRVNQSLQRFSIKEAIV